jgi:DOPA 4,5-dioxygenase
MSAPIDASVIESWHAHVYFDAASRAAAWGLRERIEAAFAIDMGRFHERPLGPHPMWSFQVAFRPDQFAELIPWLVLNRGDLVVFVHPNTGFELEDHRDRAVWLGAKLELNLAALEK